MKKIASPLAILLFAGLLFIPPVTAQTSDNLEWAIQEGDHFYMHFEYWESSGSIGPLDEEMYFNVTGAPPAIPDPLRNVSDIPLSPMGGYWLNGSDLGMMGFSFLMMWQLVLPIGNWSLMTELYENVTEWYYLDGYYPVENVTVYLDNWYSWGYSYNVTFGGAINVNNLTYSKSDGFFATYLVYGYDEITEAPLGVINVTRDGNPPVVTSPVDVEYEFGDTGNSITWTATDLNPAGYQIFQDETELRKGLWNSSSEEITVNVDGLAIASYNYTIVFYEASGANATDRVQVDVLPDTSAPEIDHPPDVTYVEGEIGNTITWNPTDSNPHAYQIFEDGIEIASGPWNSSSEVITISVDGFHPGMINFTCVVSDDSMLTAADSVWVEVLAPTTTTTTTTTTTSTTTTTTTTTTDGIIDFLTENIVIIGGIAGIGVILIIIVVLRRR